MKTSDDRPLTHRGNSKQTEAANKKREANANQQSEKGGTDQARQTMQTLIPLGVRPRTIILSKVACNRITMK